MILELLISFHNAALLWKWPESSNQTKTPEIVAVLDRGIVEVVFLNFLSKRCLENGCFNKPQESDAWYGLYMFACKTVFSIFLVSQTSECDSSHLQSLWDL